MNELEEYFENDESSDVFRKSIIAITVLLALLGAYAIYAVFTSDILWGFKINWNCFKSPLFTVLSVIGFFLQFVNWQHSSFETWIGTKKAGDSDYKWEKSNDIMDSVFGGCVWPLVSHLVIIPCMYGAAMWYAIMGLVHVLGKFAPFLIAILIVVLVVFFYKWATNLYEHKYRGAILVAMSILGFSILGATAYYMSNPYLLSSGISSLASKPESIGTCRITGNDVNLRQGPGREYEKVGMKVSMDEEYPLLDESDGWVKIDFNGTPAWLSNKFCMLIYSSSSDGAEDEDLGCWDGDDEIGDGYIPATETHSPESNEVIEVPEEVMKSVQVSQIQLVDEAKEEIKSEYGDSKSGNVTAEDFDTAPKPKADENEIYASVDVMPEFPGGNKALMTWLGANVRYPEAAQQNDVQGRVVVKFVVEKDGSIAQVQVVKGVDKDLDKEAVRVVSKMPKWTPGKSGGKVVRTYFSLPVNFRLQ